MRFEITKICKHGEWHNSTVGDYFVYMVYGHLKVDGGFYRLHYAVAFDGEDLWEYYRDEDDPNSDPKITKSDIKNYAEELACSFAMIAENNGVTVEQFINECNDTITRYC